MGNPAVLRASWESLPRKQRSDRTRRLRNWTGLPRGVRVSAHVPAVASSKQNNIIRLGMRKDLVSPIWQGLTLIPDEISRAKFGEVVVTAILLHAVKIVREEGFYKQQVQVA